MNVSTTKNITNRNHNVWFIAMSLREYATNFTFRCTKLYQSLYKRLQFHSFSIQPGLFAITTDWLNFYIWFEVAYSLEIFAKARVIDEGLKQKCMLVLEMNNQG